MHVRRGRAGVFDQWRSEFVRACEFVESGLERFGAIDSGLIERAPLTAGLPLAVRVARDPLDCELGRELGRSGRGRVALGLIPS
jgi:hypothetical protein